MPRSSSPSLALVALRLLALSAIAAPAAAQLSPPYVLPGDGIRGSSAGVEREPRIARGGDTYLAVWEDSRAELDEIPSSGGYTPFKTDIYAARFDAAGNQIDTTAILVSSQTWTQERPHVAWNGSTWLVVWEARRVTPSWHTVGILGARVSADGKLLDAVPFVIDDRDDVDEENPVVAGDGQNWVVFWNDWNTPKTKRIVGGTLVHPDGFVEPQRNFFGTTNGNYVPYHVNIAFAGGTFLMTSEHSKSGQNGYLWGQRFDTTLAMVGGEFKIASYSHSHLAASDTGFYVMWNTNSDMRGTPVSASGQVLLPGGEVLWTFNHLLEDWQPTSSWTGSDWLVTYEDRNLANGETGLFALDVDAAGKVAGAPVLITSNSYVVNNSVSAGGAGVPGDAFILWEDDRDSFWDLYQVTYSTGGTFGTLAPMSNSAPAQTQPDLAGDATVGYLAVYQSELGHQSRILAQRLDGAGNPLGSEPIEVISKGATQVRHPAVAWDGTRFLVVWEDWHPKTHTKDAMVRGRRVAPDGTLLDPIAIDIMSGDRPEVGALGGEFLVVASLEPVDHSRSIRRMRVEGSSGALLDATEDIISTGYALYPDTLALGNRWLVVWQRAPTHDSSYTQIQGTWVDAVGNAGAPFIAENAAEPARRPALSAIGDVGLIAFNDRFDILARRIKSDGTFLDPEQGFFISTATDDQFHVAVGSDGVEFVAAWTDFRASQATYEPGLGDVYAARIAADGTVIDQPDGLAVADDERLPEGNTALAGDAEVTLIAYADLLPEAATYRIVIRKLGDDQPVGTNYCGPANLNSSGAAAEIAGTGSPIAQVNDLTLTATQLPTNQFGYFVTSETQGFVPNPGGSQGNLCLGGAILRFSAQIQNSGAQGVISIPVDLSALPSQPPHTVVAGETWNFQAWFRDKNPGTTSNFTDGLSILFQ